jgi:hypothetical protein
VPRAWPGNEGTSAIKKVRTGASLFMAIYNFYPLFIAVAGVGIAAVLSERALTLLQADAKGALIDAFARVRWMNLVGVSLFAALLLWRVPIAWAALGVEYTLLSAWSVLRVRALKLPQAVSSRLIASVVLRALGIATCAFIYAVRLSL